MFLTVKCPNNPEEAIVEGKLITIQVAVRTDGSGALNFLPIAEVIRAIEAAYLRAVLKATNGNMTAAAKLAGRDRTWLYRLAERRGVKPSDFRQEEEERVPAEAPLQ